MALPGLLREHAARQPVFTLATSSHPSLAFRRPCSFMFSSAWMCARQMGTGKGRLILLSAPPFPSPRRPCTASVWVRAGSAIPTSCTSPSATLGVLQRRQPHRPHLTWADRALLAALLSVIPKARRQGLQLLVTPDTILRWHRDIVRGPRAGHAGHDPDRQTTPGGLRERSRTGHPGLRHRPAVQRPRPLRRGPRCRARLCRRPGS
jgi:hypothetical protein